MATADAFKSLISISFLLTRGFVSSRCSLHSFLYFSFLSLAFSVRFSKTVMTSLVMLSDTVILHYTKVNLNSLFISVLLVLHEISDMPHVLFH